MADLFLLRGGYLGGEYAWAIPAHEEFLRENPEGNTHAYLALASCYRHFGEYKKAEAVLDAALRHLPEPPFRIMTMADIEDHRGDLYADMGDLRRAREHYQKAIDLYPTAKPPYGEHLLHRRAAKVRSKVDVLAMRTLAAGKLRDGTYRGVSLGYAEDLTVSLTVKGGKIADIALEHTEKIDLGATRILPKRIIERQSLQVDGITGATVTCNAIVEGALVALRKAGL